MVSGAAVVSGADVVSGAVVSAANPEASSSTLPRFAVLLDSTVPPQLLDTVIEYLLPVA